MKRSDRHSDMSHPELQSADFVVWRVSKGKQQMRDNRITRAYNMRDRLRPETRH